MTDKKAQVEVFENFDDDEERARYHMQAETARHSVRMQLTMMFNHLNRDAATNGADAGPIVQGALIGWLEFLLEGSEMTDDEVKAATAALIDDFLPQYRANMVMLEALARNGGQSGTA